jgi:hypothetical protein
MGKVNDNCPLPRCFFVNADSKGKRAVVSGLGCTLARGIGSANSKRVAGDIIGRGVLWWEAMGAARDGKRCGEENMGEDSMDLYYCQ